MILEAYKNLIGDRIIQNMTAQVIVILVLYIAGLIPIMLLRKRLERVWMYLLAFPMGLSLYAVSGFLLLTTGIRFCAAGIVITYVIILGLVVIYRARIGRGIDITPSSLVATLVIVTLAAVFACSGILPQNVTNDSVYYYSVYPSILVRDGFFSASLDKFLTDVGQTTAVVQCLPFMFGFDETFGIQHFFNLNFILIFFAALKERFERSGIRPGKMLYAISALGTLFLVTCEPYIVMSTWILSNMYFMELYFTVFYLFLKSSEEDGDTAEYDLILFFLTSMLIMTRMEGGVMVFVLALALSFLNVGKKRLLLIFGSSLCLMELWYYVNLFVKIGVDPLYSFLDAKAALLMAAVIVGFFVYIIFIRDRIHADIAPLLLMGVLILGNLGLLFINRERYLTNLKAFILNIRLGNGWGIFISVIIVYCLIFAFSLFRGGFRKTDPERRVALFLPALMVLTIIAVCFARGGVLAVRTSDSGNRVLMETVPVIIYSIFSVWRVK